ncbi:MAG: sulfotransferase family protein [Pseudohaliea sp.]
MAGAGSAAPGDTRALKALLAARDFPALLRATEGQDGATAPERWLYRGKALEGLLRLEAAADCYGAGLERWPEAASLHLALGQLALREGDRPTALEALERARSLNPDSLDCYAALLHLVPLAPDGPEAARILARALDHRRGDAARARALFLLGQLQVEAGRDRTGFIYYAAGNALARDAIEERKREYRIPERLLRMDRKTFTAAARSLPPCNTLVVSGLPRSGKSLVEGLLAEHRAVVAGGEFAGLRRAVAAAPPGELPARLRAAAARGQSPFAQAYREHPLSERLLDKNSAAGAAASERWLVDSSPANLPRLGYFGLLHPDVPVVLCRRRAPDLGLALYFKKFRSGHGYSYDLAAAGRAIARAERLIAHWQAVLPNPVLVVDYEDLVTEPARLRNRLFAHLGLSLPPQAEAAANRTPGEQGTAAAGGWRLFPSKSPGAGSALDPALLGFAGRFKEELTPLVAAYEAERG